MPSPARVTMTSTEAFPCGSMPPASSKLPLPVGESWDTNDNKPVELPRHNSSRMDGARIPERKSDVTELGAEIAYKSPVNGLLAESISRMSGKFGQAASTARQ